MSQQDVMDALEKIGKPVSRGEIAKFLKQDIVLVSHSIARLVKGNDIKIIEINREQAMKIYKCKRRMRLYYL